MADASNHRLSYIPEATIGTMPTSPRLIVLPDSRTTLGMGRDLLSSERISPDRYPEEPRTGAQNFAGEIPVDLSWRTYDDFLASALQGQWADQHVGADQVDLNVDGGGITTYDIEDSFVTAGGNVFIEEIDATLQRVVFRFEPSSGSFTNHVSENLTNLTIDGSTFNVETFTDVQEIREVIAGTDRLSMTMVREFRDLTALNVQRFLGCEVTSMNISASANDLAKATFNLLGQQGNILETALPANSSLTVPAPYKAFDTFSGELKIDDTATCIVTELSLDLDNNYEPRYAVGCQGTQDPAIGQSNISGNITVFFEDTTFLTKFVNEESFALEFAFADPLGNELRFILPNCVVGADVKPDVGGEGDITLPVAFTAHKDETIGSHLLIRSTAGTP